MGNDSSLRMVTDDRSVWTVSDVRRDTSWRTTLTQDHVAAAAQCYKSNPDHPDLASKDCWRDLKHRIGRELRTGRGFFLVQGFPLAADMARTRALYAAFGRIFGAVKSQNIAGDTIGEVADMGADYASDPNARGYMSSDELKPHTDGCDLTALLCVRPARSGGATAIASAGEIHNRILSEAPEEAQALYNGFYNDLRGYGKKRVGDETSDIRWPVFMRHQGVFSCGFNSKTIRTAPRKNGVPLSKTEAAAVDHFETLAMGAALAMKLVLQPGDLFIFNNLVTVHYRDKFVDDETHERKRLLLRLWLNDFTPRPLPDFAAQLVRAGIPAS